MPQINAAVATHGVPASIMKSIMRLESGGDPTNGSPQGAYGLMQIMPDWEGHGGYSRYDPAQNVMLGALILKEAHDRWVAQGAPDPWQEAVRDYIGRGRPDAFGTDQNSYWARISQFLGELGGYGGTTPAAATGGGSLESMFPGGSSVPDWGGFNVPSSNGLYGYGTAYGLNGTNHTGIDIPMAPGSPMRAAFSGHVVCAATGSGTGEDSCAAFNCVGFCPNGTAGRIQIMSDDGNTVLIYGHSSGTAVTPGQRVTAGQLVGYSGGQNSAHVHLEARVKDPSMPSGWRIVDPRQVLGSGGGGGSFAGGSAPAPGGYGGSTTTPYQSGMGDFTSYFLSLAGIG
jgi:murein DD-endopeptidase MepM/ murein hydrolase activator NlpD